MPNDLDSMIQGEQAQDVEEVLPVVAASGVIEDINVEALVAEYRDVRAELDDARHTYQDFEIACKEKMAIISMKLREIADKMHLNALPTNAGTAYRTTKEHFRVGDWNQILEWIKANNHWQVLEKRIAKLATKEIYEATGVMPPGVEYSAEIEFVVRKNSKSV